MARTGAYWHVLARTGKGTMGTKGNIGKNEDFRTLSKSAHDDGRGEKSNEEAFWLCQERLIF